MVRALLMITFTILASNVYAFEKIKTACKSQYDAEPSVFVDVQKEDDVIKAYVKSHLATRVLLCTDDKDVFCTHKFNYVNGMMNSYILDTFKINVNGEIIYTSEFSDMHAYVHLLTAYTCERLN